MEKKPFSTGGGAVYDPEGQKGYGIDSSENMSDKDREDIIDIISKVLDGTYYINPINPKDKNVSVYNMINGPTLILDISVEEFKKFKLIAEQRKKSANI